ncbi:MAG: ATP-binding protein [Candidatus Aquicultorales bacterium]
MAELYVRKINREITTRLIQPRNFIQVLYGPRQVGKTTSIRQVLADIDLPYHYASADQPTIRDETWLEAQWKTARLKVKENQSPAVIAIDEVQKIANWSEVVKRLWDEDTYNGIFLQVVLLGSSPLLMQKGLTESLAGRFELIRAGHWSFTECREYFGWDADTFIYHGGYPGAALLIGEPERWRRYINDSLIETTLSRDILLMTRVDKPALLRRLFNLGCEYSAQVLSYQKMVGQLQDAGNTTTLAHYLDLLGGAGFVTGLSKYAGEAVRRRGSSPKLQVFDTALITAQSHISFEDAKVDRELWGRLLESAIGAHLLSITLDKRLELYYWRERDKEVDFVIRNGRNLIAIEVKSGRKKGSLSGMAAFDKTFSPNHKLLVGADGIPIADFLRSDLSDWL